MSDEDVVRAFLRFLGRPISRMEDLHVVLIRGHQNYARGSPLSPGEVEEEVVAFLAERNPTGPMEEALYRALKRVEAEKTANAPAGGDKA